jgi:hypothetical protein
MSGCYRAKLSQEDDAFLVTSSLLEPMTFQTDIRLALEPEMSDVQMDIACKLEKINSYMSQKDCQVLFGVLRANWAEGAPLSEPGLLLMLLSVIGMFPLNLASFTLFP